METNTARNRKTESAASMPSFQFSLRVLFVLVALCGLALAIIVPLLRYAHHVVALDQSVVNMKVIALSLLNYHDVYGSFPPAYVCDEQGKPMHSWRVLIDPFLDAPTARQYDFSEPWNGRNNVLIGSKPNWHFHSPADPQSPPQMTNYVAVVGRATIWPGRGSTRIADILDGSSNTILIVEIMNSDIHWMEPRDLPIEELEAWLDPKHKPSILTSHVNGGMVACADGSVQYLPRDTTIETLRRMLGASDFKNKDNLQPP